MSQTAPSRFIKDLDHAVRGYGWTWHRTKSNVHFRGPAGQLIVVPCTEHARTRMNARAQFRRAGVPI